MKSRLQKSIEYIKGYCDKHDNCSSCRLQNKDTTGCKLQDTVPCEWKYKTESEDKE